MSDSEDNVGSDTEQDRRIDSANAAPTEKAAVPAKEKKPISEKAKQARSANLAKARQTRIDKSVEKKEAEKMIVTVKKMAQTAGYDSSDSDSSDDDIIFKKAKKGKVEKVAPVQAPPVIAPPVKPDNELLKRLEALELTNQKLASRYVKLKKKASKNKGPVIINQPPAVIAPPATIQREDPFDTASRKQYQRIMSHK